MRLTRRYRFCASHRLHAPQLGVEENRALYGKCNNPHGHGHNYVLEVSVRGPVDETTGLVANTTVLDRLVARDVLAPFDHANLNLQAPAFRTSVPTTENLALEISRRLLRDWSSSFPAGTKLEKIRLHETGRNIFELLVEQE
ncbi:MAG: 6-carboxytetrahydropterin synthase [Bryobacteraceae bacterium]|nr:6-carboxytetrahydropterin synthase [Bryobacteraceae bacterium]